MSSRHTIPATDDDRLKFYWNGLTYKTSDNKIDGSGKTTLIECLAGRRVAGLSGRVWVKSTNDKEPLASDKKSRSHDLNAHNMLEVFGLLGCAQVKTGAISGGQKKRLSIALELIFSPNILLLDEPTTGLDSASSFQCLSLLKTLSYNKEPLVIAVSIHQPTARLLAFFDSIYVLSVDGRCIYSGPTDRLITHLSNFDLNCPAIDTLVTYERQRLNPKLESMRIAKHESIVGPKNCTKNKSKNESKRTVNDQLRDVWILLKRAHVTSMRNPLIVWLRILGLAIALSTKLLVYSRTHAGQSDGGCTDMMSVLSKLRTIAVKESTIHKSFKNVQNISYIITTTMFIHFVTIAPTLMTFPIELNTFVKNYRSHNNGNGKHHMGGDNYELNEQREPLASDKKSRSHDLNAHNMLEVFGLLGCAQVKTGAISGGQKKRLSIALELIFSPNILLLDEPTTGLDSASSFQCLSLLKTLSYNKEPLVIAVSIHQPTARLLAFFDSIYVLSVDGRCIYSGPTDRLITHLSNFDLNCPAIDTLVTYERQRLNPKLESMRIAKHESIVGPKNCTKNKSKNESKRTVNDQLRDVWILLKRAHVTSMRNPLIVWLRILGLAIALSTKLLVYSRTHAGQSDGGCTDMMSVLSKLRTIAVKESTIHKSFKNVQNISYIITTTMFIHFVTIAPTLMTFPIELNTFVKEHFNKWYTCWSYFTARSLVDIPVVVVIPIVYGTIMWWMTDQVWDGWRFSVHLLIMVLLALVSHSLGLLLSAIFINNIRASLLSFTIFVTPLLLFSGALIPIRTLPSYLQTFSYLSIFRLSYESMLIILYGFNRCPTLNDPLTMDSLTHEFGVNMYHMEECLEEADSLANVTRNSLSAINRLVAKQNPSRILEWFGLQDTDLYIYISLFIAYTAIDTLASHERQTLNTKLESIRIAKNESIVDNRSDTKINAKTDSKQSLNDQLRDIWVLTKRAQLVSIRNPHVIWLRFLFMIISLFTKLMMYSDVKVGQLGGGECADRESVLARLSEFGNREGTERFRALQQNSSYILSNILFIHAVNIGPTLMTFTVELNIFVKEHFNKWYTCWSYFTARSLVDIPIVLILTIMFSTIMWWITGQ
ncbi:unnamed protein product [Oppiella nova]|uniref:ABC transporter domain-containing protein n=1 Tax=Oppiella nova TaxID=334625 RepID=A0A7R9LKN4_9ACAR|nr:unnamed protein product [Oppiella nova]CAG2164544.1 unnamed protein product [Oppiella nova]